MVERAKRNPKIRFLSNAAVTLWLGTDGVLSGLKYKDTVTGIERQVGEKLRTQCMNVVKSAGCIQCWPIHQYLGDGVHGTATVC
jgi:hypothetical protein